MGSMIGKTYGHYRIVAEIGKGGMGTVYLAEHTVIGRKAVIKVLHDRYASRSDLTQRLLNEARAPNAVGHPDLIEIYDAGTTLDGVVYLVMEHLQGKSLHEVVQEEGPLTENVARALGARIARALAAAHAKGIVHRDLKPKNLFLVPDVNRPDETHVKVLDFGIAKLTEASMEAGINTEESSTLGSPAYMSPEQTKGAENVDRRADIYSLGVVLYECLTGRLPFKAKSFGQLVTLILQATPVPVRAWADATSPELETLVMRCLEKDPVDRFQSMEELAVELEKRGRPAPTIQLQVVAKPLPPPPDAGVSSQVGTVAATPGARGVESGTAPTVALNGEAPATTSLSQTTLASGAGEATSLPPAEAGRPGRGWVWAASVGVTLLLALGGGWYVTGLSDRGDADEQSSERGGAKAAASATTAIVEPPVPTAAATSAASSADSGSAAADAGTHRPKGTAKPKKRPPKDKSWRPEVME